MFHLGRLALLWVAAFGLRLLYIVQSRHNPFFDFPLVDAKTYTETAKLIATTSHWLGGSQPFWQPPLYPYFLGLIYTLFEPDYLLPRLVQAALGATLCLLIYQIGRRVFSPAVGWLAAIASIFYSPLIFFEAEFLPPILAILINLLGLLSLFWAISGKKYRLFLPGFLFGLSSLCIGNILLCIPGIVLWLLWLNRNQPKPIRLLHVIPFLLGVLLVIAPVTLRNYLIGNDLVLISTNAGLNFYIGNNAQYDATVQIQPGPAWLELVSQPRSKAGITQPSAQSQYFFTQAWHFMRAHPLAYLKLQCYKLYLFWNGNEIGRNQDLYFARQYSSVLHVLLWKYGIAFPFGLLAPLALLGFGLSWRHGLLRQPFPLLLSGFTVIYLVSVVMFFISARYRLPIIPILLLFAAYACQTLYRNWQQRSYKHLFWSAGICSMLLLLCNWGADSDTSSHAQTYHRLGYVYEKKGLLVNAMGAYKKALELNPKIRTARYNLASIQARRGEYERAISGYRTFIQHFPEINSAHLALGDAYLHSRRYADAVSTYQKLHNKTLVDTIIIQGRLAYAYVQLGNLDKAATAFQELITAKPDSLQARYQLGQLYENIQRPNDARAQYEAILALDSTYIDARYHLANFLFAEENPTAAKAHLKYIIAQNPRAVDARYLLSKQYIVEHRADVAMEQIKAILAIQPKHQQANRLAGHLYMALGDTLKGIEYLERFTNYYREGRQTEILDQLKDQWRSQLKTPATH